jgi:hypothetical protein
MTRLLPPITCVFVGMVATLVSSCARDCVAPEAAYAPRPSAGLDYGSGPGIPQYGPPPGAPPYGPPPGSYPYGPPPGAQYGAPPGSQYGPRPGAS